MNKNVRAAILKILLLEEEHTKKDLAEAVKFISNNLEDTLLGYLAGNDTSVRKSSSSAKPASEQISKAVIDLKDKDVEKYELLKGFDQLLRKGELLPRLDSIKQLGARFSKEYEAGKSRKESIPRLMSLLATISTSELKLTITDIVNSSGKQSSEYAELANYLIHGNSNKTLNK